MNWSLNEVEALARKAARGAGYDWGHAEEAGAAVRWLCARGLAGGEALADLLDWRADQPGHKAPELSDDGWHAADGLCPLVAGAMMLDGVIGAGDAVPLTDVVAPLMLLPALAEQARQSQCARALHWDGGSLTLDAQAALCTADDPALPPARADVRITTATAPGAKRVTPAFRAGCTPAVMERLNAYAGRTYAPATEASRASGAGAGLSDND